MPGRRKYAQETRDRAVNVYQVRSPSGAATPPAVESEGRGHTALVTGASAGIGCAFAELLAARGYDLVVVARRRERLEALKDKLSTNHQVNVHVICTDLAKPGACRVIKEELDRLGITVDFLVNNAGYSLLAAFGDVPWAEWEALLRVLGTSVLELTSYLLPGMLDQGWGRIVNVTSVSAYFSGSPGQTLYAPIKSLVHKFSLSVAQEYEGRGIICTTAPPGVTDTEIFKQLGPNAERYVASNRLVRAAMMSPAEYCEVAYRGCMQGRRVVVPGIQNKVWAFLLQHVPPGVRYAMCRFSAKLAAS